MKVQSPLRELVRVLFHLNGGYTRVSAVRTEGLGAADGGIVWEIPTAIIPAHLRPIGSHFLVVIPCIIPEDGDSPDAIRRMLAAVEVHELTGQDTEG